MFDLLPTDWKEPQWDVHEKVHGWRNYISERVQELWPTFSDEQKQALAKQAENHASNEHWD